MCVPALCDTVALFGYALKEPHGLNSSPTATQTRFSVEKALTKSALTGLTEWKWNAPSTASFTFLRRN